MVDRLLSLISFKKLQPKTMPGKAVPLPAIFLIPLACSLSHRKHEVGVNSTSLASPASAALASAVVVASELAEAQQAVVAATG